MTGMSDLWRERLGHLAWPKPRPEGGFGGPAKRKALRIIDDRNVTALVLLIEERALAMERLWNAERRLDEVSSRAPGGDADVVDAGLAAFSGPREPVRASRGWAPREVTDHDADAETEALHAAVERDAREADLAAALDALELLERLIRRLPERGKSSA